MAFATVIHTTDMHPDSWAGLLKSWSDTPGAGNAATFGIGLTETVQWIPINRNANHAGGPSHGAFRVNGMAMHPNLVTVGIEIHNAGQVRHVNGEWHWGESPGKGQPWAPQGTALPDQDVQPDPDRPGKGWHKPNAYQLATLDKLLLDLEQILQPLPQGCTVESGGREKPPTWALTRTPRRVGHITLDPERRSDPWPLIMRHINGG